jgi:carbamate kinase
MRVVVALGGNALLKRGEPMTAEVQRGNVKTAANSLAPVAEKHQLVLSHGNGPQVGLLALQGAAYEEVDTYPLDVLGAQTEGMIGYMIEQELGNLLPFEVPFATILTMVEVDPDDPAFKDPTKFVGPVYDEAEAKNLAAEKGWSIKPASGALPITETDLRNPAHKMAAGKEHSRDLRRGWGYSHHVSEGCRSRSNRRRSCD